MALGSASCILVMVVLAAAFPRVGQGANPEMSASRGWEGSEETPWTPGYAPLRASGDGAGGGIDAAQCQAGSEGTEAPPRDAPATSATRRETLRGPGRSLSCGDASFPKCGGTCPPYNICQPVRVGAANFCSCVGKNAECGENDPLCGGVCPSGRVCVGDVFGFGQCTCSPPRSRAWRRVIEERASARARARRRRIGTQRAPAPVPQTSASATVPAPPTTTSSTAAPTTTTSPTTQPTTTLSTTALSTTTLSSTTLSTTILATTTLSTTTVTVPTTTTTTTLSTTTVTVVTTTTTTTTATTPATASPPRPCDASAYPSCDGECPPGEVCALHTDATGADICACVHVGAAVVPCGEATGPACDGACPPGTACIPLAQRREALLAASGCRLGDDRPECPRPLSESVKERLRDIGVGPGSAESAGPSGECVCFDVLGAACGVLGPPVCGGACPTEHALCSMVGDDCTCVVPPAE